MTFRPKALLLLGLALVAMPAVAQQATAPQPSQDQRGILVKSAVFDLEAVQGNAAAFKDIRRQTQDLRSAFNADQQKEATTLRAASDDLMRQRAILSPEAFAEERRKLDQQAADAERRLQIRAHQIDVVVKNALDVVQAALNQVVGDLVKENNITLLFTRQAVYAVAQQLDVTDEIMTALDKRLSAVKVANPNTVKVDVPPSPSAATTNAPSAAPAATRSNSPPAQAPAGKTAKPAPAR